MQDERTWLLLAKRQAGEATEQELEELNALMAHRKGSAGDELIEKIWNTPLQSLPELRPGQTVWDRIELDINRPPRRRPVLHRPLVRWLAAAVFAGTAFLLYFLNREESLQERHRPAKTIATQAASRKHILLPDGTQVWVNVNSKLYYPAVFSNGTREVKLEGEAFFDVARKEGQPFIIHAANVHITVKGTAFNVKAYPEQKQVETSLIHGLIEITTSHDPERKILLKPEEKIIIPTEVKEEPGKPHRDQDADGMLFTITRLKKDEQDVLPETVWMNKSLAFDNEPLEQVVPKLESWFAVTIHITDTSLRSRRFSGEITKETVTQTLEALQLSYPFSFSIGKNEIWISK